MQVLLPARHPGQGGRPEARLPVCRRAQDRRDQGDYLQRVMHHHDQRPGPHRGNGVATHNDLEAVANVKRVTEWTQYYGHRVPTKTENI